MSAIVFSLVLLGIKLPFKATPMPATPTKPIQHSEADFPVHLVNQRAVKITKLSPTTYLVDFGKVAFGNISIQPPPTATGEITVHFGEASRNGRIDRTPPGTVRYKMTRANLTGDTPQIVAPAKDARNTEATSTAHPPAILTPPEWGVVLPFRWVEIESYEGDLQPANITRRAAFPKTWDDRAATFRCSDNMLNQVWDLCKYSIKATSFAGIFVDGDRERIPYEADAYLNQLSYYATTNDNQIPRATFDHLMKHGTWPTEWPPHMVFMAYADWMKTGDTMWLKARYDDLKTKILADRVDPDGLVQSSKAQMARDDIIDWPASERDGYVFGPQNTVVNAFRLRAIKLMTEMARAIGRDDEAESFAAMESKARFKFQQTFFDPQRVEYRDATGTEHSSLHANLFPLAFGLVPPDSRQLVAKNVAARGMKCSVYAAQYLLEVLFENGEAQAAIDLITAGGDRSWRHMVESGTTITWEAWDQKYKPNQDWNHAWGAAPANLLPRYVLGVQPMAPGWKRALIKPHLGNLTFARGKVPTPLGTVTIESKRTQSFTMSINLPKGMTAQVELPTQPNATQVLVNGKPAPATQRDGRWILTKDISGSAKIELV